MIYVPCLMLALALPTALMGGIVRPALAAGMVGLAGYLVWKRTREGWRLAPAEDPAAETRTGRTDPDP